MREQMSKEKEELKDCPFCGGSPELKYRGNDHTEGRVVTIVCTTKKCRAKQRTGAIRFNMAWCEKKAIEKWNKRAK